MNLSLTGPVANATEATTAWLGSDSHAQTSALNWFLLALKRGNETLPGLVTGCLGPSLTSTDPPVRARAIELLATLLERFPSLVLPENVSPYSSLILTMMYLCRFFSS